MPDARREALAARERFVRRLAGSAPDHRPQSTRLGAGLLTQTDPLLASLLPVNPVPSAVLIALMETEGEPGILLTVRAAHLRAHAGQIAFPGGRIEADDDGPAGAALREAEEEVGLPRDSALVLGYLPDQLVLTGFRITPVVASVETFQPRHDQREVQDSFILPWSTLLTESSYRDTVRRYGEHEVAVREIHHGQHRIWGATAGILLTLVEMSRP